MPSILSKLAPTKRKRIRACVLIEDGGGSMREACKAVEIDLSGFSRMKWLEKYQKGGVDALLMLRTGTTRFWLR